eukprot:4263882-Prymnesium_polylepis.1
MPPRARPANQSGVPSRACSTRRRAAPMAPRSQRHRRRRPQHPPPPFLVWSVTAEKREIWRVAGM